MIQRIKTHTPAHVKLWQRFTEWNAARRARLQRAACVAELDALNSQLEYIRLRAHDLRKMVRTIDDNA